VRQIAHCIRGQLCAGAERGLLNRLGQALIAEQRGDGGWSQLPRLESDAYATGETLGALHEAAHLPVLRNNDRRREIRGFISAASIR
jgi:hypothetical protein